MSIKKALAVLFVVLLLGAPLGDGGAQEKKIFRRSNFSNEFNIKTYDGINARGFATVESEPVGHKVKIHVDGLSPGALFVILNHWFEPIPERGIISAIRPNVFPSCTGHLQLLTPVIVDEKGEINVAVEVDQLAPHIWVVDGAKFIKLTGGSDERGNPRFSRQPDNADAFITGGVLIPFSDLLKLEARFKDLGRLIAPGGCPSLGE